MAVTGINSRLPTDDLMVVTGIEVRAHQSDLSPLRSVTFLLDS